MREIYMSGPMVDAQDLELVKDAILNGWYGENAYNYVENFEKNFAEYHGRKFALMTPNCTSAIHLFLKAINVSPENNVIAPDCTWIGSVAGVEYQKSTLKFADIDPESWCIDVESAIDLIDENTIAIISVNLYGNMANYEKLEKICKERNIFLLEDAAESLGSILNNRKSGSFGDASVFSFHRTKTLTTGEGGMLLLDDRELFERCKLLRDHGRKPGSFFIEEVTNKYMPFNLQAALGQAQFNKLETLIQTKINILNRYRQNLDGINGLQLNPEPENGRNGVWAPALVFDAELNINSKALMEYLSNAELPVRPFFYPLSSMPAFAKADIYEQKNVNAYSISKRGVNLPSAMNLSNNQIDFYCDAIKEFMARC